MTYHIVNNRKVDVGHYVHYTDLTGMDHAALVTDLKDKDGNSHANLKVTRREHGRDDYLENVPHSATGKAHSWNHISE